jgi:hypothetical protein
MASCAAGFGLPLVQIIRLAAWLGLASLLCARFFAIASPLIALSGADFAASCARGLLSALIILPLAAAGGALLERMAMLATHSLRIAKLQTRHNALLWAAKAKELLPAKDAFILSQSLEAHTRPGTPIKTKRL